MGTLILLLGSQSRREVLRARHPELAQSLELPRPTMGRFVSTALVPAEPSEPESTIQVQSRTWRRAPTNEHSATAPELPRQGKAAE
ncbi:NaeI family type II restriction endonuclease [Amycolatopsis sp. NPDC049253]|uniref:NaeI family type II restriction endonuclease n=1 Tax=Amycolatopsis sp. NPDC049253 TaxID=3155274 RepID=UPI00342A3122